MRLIKYPVILGFCTFLAACANTDSSNVTTAGIYADFDVTNLGNQSNVVAQLKVGGAISNTVLELSGGDELIAYNGSQSYVMIKDDSFIGDVKYRATFTGDPGGTQYTITFNRPSTNESLASSVILPDAFNLTSDNSGSYTSNDDIWVTWTPASALNNTAIRLSGICGSFYTTTPPNSTGINIPLSDVSKVFISDPDSCTLSLEVSRQNTRSVNSQFGEGGSFVAKQIRSSSFAFQYTP